MIQQLTVDVKIDVFDVLCQLSQDWRLSIGVDGDSPLMAGYWMRVIPLEVGEGDLHEEFKYERIRLATHQEIIRMEAFKNITEYTVRLF